MTAFMLARALLTDNPTHVLACGVALRDVHSRLTALQRCDKRADHGLTLALNGHVTRVAGYIAQVRSEQDAAIMYHVHVIKGCECPDAPQSQERCCAHWWSAFLMALAYMKLAANAYVPVPAHRVAPAVSLDDTISRRPGRAALQPHDRDWAQPSNREHGREPNISDSARWERPTDHQTAWAMTVRSWANWLDAH